MKLDLKFGSKTIGPDLGSGLTLALVSIPEGMCAGYLTHPPQCERCSGLSCLELGMLPATKSRGNDWHKKE